MTNKKQQPIKIQLQPSPLCTVCDGYGWWPYGDLCPLGPIDGREMSHISIQCPWCKHGKVKSGERYKLLVQTKANKDREDKLLLKQEVKDNGTTKRGNRKVRNGSKV